MTHARMLIASALVLLGCTAGAPPPDDDVAVSSEAATSDAATSSEQTAPVAPVSSVPPIRTINVTADNWSFSPSSIVLKKGEKVQLRLTGKAGIHGFAVPELGVNQSIQPGQTVNVAVPTDKAGTFSFFCSIPCGQGHRDMKGSITIQP